MTMNKLISFLLSFFLCTLLGAGLTRVVMQLTILPDFKTRTIKDTKADLLAHPEFLQKMANAYQAQQETYRKPKPQSWRLTSSTPLNKTS
ncbi:hypothetical protein L1D34_26655 [Vibrio mediterranei]|uniref:hypothetical protein n=1 Tax=Vibrio mediterranei TaxID=689 RepID=UPI001EFD50DB|nr:hypothetical protein [Vibrio mediterranei]MCG9628402.1 hypothetical protein [Vibrio mediterranei]